MFNFERKEADPDLDWQLELITYSSHMPSRFCLWNSYQFCYSTCLYLHKSHIILINVFWWCFNPGWGQISLTPHLFILSILTLFRMIFKISPPPKNAVEILQKYTGKLYHWQGILDTSVAFSLCKPFPTWVVLLSEPVFLRSSSDTRLCSIEKLPHGVRSCFCTLSPASLSYLRGGGP